MPFPSTPSRTAGQRANSSPHSKTKTVDVGSPLGVYDTNSVRDRVRQWQSQGGGVITESDVGAAEDDGEALSCKGDSSKKKHVSNPSRSREKDPVSGAGSSTSQKRNGRGKAKIAEDERDRSRSGSAPAKRVVSDAHWRKKRTPPKSSTSSRPTKDGTPKKTPMGDGIRVGAIYKAKSDARSQKENVKKSPKRDIAGVDDGIRVFSTPPGSRRPSGQARAPQGSDMQPESEVRSDLEGTSSRSTSSHPLDSAQRGEHPVPDKAPRIVSSATKLEAQKRRGSNQKPKAAEESPLSAQGGLSGGMGSMKSHKGNILSQVFGDSRRMFNKPQAVPVSAPRVPSVEAWLNETPDPFVDTDEPPIEPIAPLRPTHKVMKQVPEEIHTVEDPNKIWEALEAKPSPRAGMHGSKRRRRVPSSAIYEDNPFPAGFNSGSPLATTPSQTTSASKLVDIVKDTPELSPSSIRRGGAKRNPSSPTRDRRKSRSSKVVPDEEEVASVLSTSLSASSVEAPDPKTPLRPPGLNLNRPFPSTGKHRLSTIASVETFDSRAQDKTPPSVSGLSEVTIQPSTSYGDEYEAEARDSFDPNSLRRSRSRTTKHADLISILSLPRAGSKSIQSARSIRTNRSRLATATVEDLMQELATDESKYMRELRTLVDGVIPVLLTCVFSKSDSSVAAELFKPSAKATYDPNFTKPIVDMGIALERLKTLHKRIPEQDPNHFLTWAQGAQRVYAEYLKAWRMGFQDVVVNLAPATEGTEEPNTQRGSTGELEGGLPRNEDGDVVNGDGERVDVAFLLKRPLVRLKYLAKTLKGINIKLPSPEADSLATKYQNLVVDARNRSNEERARLEDEAASNIDPTRAREPRTLAPLTGVRIDRTRRVRARDHFNLALQHSTGQRIDCRVELLLRDEASGSGAGSDVLICEVDGTGRWLLFPPVQSGCVSARNGDVKGEIVVMVRGFASNGQEWQEMFSLRSDDEEAGFEWVQMLGLIPVPPKVQRSQSFLKRHQREKSDSEQTSSTLEPPITPSTPGKSRTPSPREIDIPIGEQPHGASKLWTEAPVREESPSLATGLQSRDRARLQKKKQDSPLSTPLRSLVDDADEGNDRDPLLSPTPSRQSGLFDLQNRPRNFKEALGLTGTSSAGLMRSKAKRRSRHFGDSPTSPRSTKVSEEVTQSPSTSAKQSGNEATAETPGQTAQRSLSPDYDLEYSPNSRTSLPKQSKEATRPSHHRSRSSVPSLELPTIPKARKNSPPTTPVHEPDEEPDWGPITGRDDPRSSSKLTKKRPKAIEVKAGESSSPTPPVHRSPSPIQLKESKTPILGAGKATTTRRSSSPLKHEYEPSTASDTSSDSDTSTIEHNQATSISDSSEDEELEDGDTPTPLLPLGVMTRFPKVSPQNSLPSLPGATLAPSQSASQAPYKTVPPQPTKACKTIASIFAWSDKGSWQSLHPDECSIVISPGLIEAYEMSASHSENVPLSSSTPVLDADIFSDLASNLAPESKDNQYERPLVALELTPLVPLRRGTALDISIRSPPTPNSQITSGNNIMFRSRNPEECEALYALINHSRIHNPTYVALQNARGPYGSGNSFSSSMDRRPSTTRPSSRSGSWFGGLGRSSSYRANSAPTPSIAPSESSISSMTSAFSALKRFGRGGGGSCAFNIARSTISSRVGSRANSIYTSSDNSSGSGASSPMPPSSSIGGDSGKAGPIGLSNAKIRLYSRETASRWRDMGSARLTIMRPTNASHPPGSSNGSRPSSARGGVSDEKRIVVNGKTKGEVLLDVQLGESCFERIARTGIALSVWEDVVGPNGEVGVVGAVGGVAGRSTKVYMIQVCFLLISLLTDFETSHPQVEDVGDFG